MDGIELMASAMQAARTRLDVAASNLANASSDGFARRVAHARLNDGGLTVSTAVDTHEGPLRRTGRALDVASVGGGFLVRDPGLGTQYVRSASLERNAAGELIDERGRVVLDGNKALHASGEAIIDDRGVVRDGGKIVGHLHLLAGTELRSGFISATNVDSVHEMVGVLEAQRSFETAQKTLVAIDTVREKDADNLGKIPQ
ncbi:MAG TPA: flagellar basal body rod C-terminal domain-containing protein [Candidatus Baltobacteraceae bacterium]|jgi:flagellar basal body rod protein FlgG|nr:flagellar basal body rod C-terminal domain-containing protein [Candidatus Baltobacteraceae bacterium]